MGVEGKGTSFTFCRLLRRHAGRTWDLRMRGSTGTQQFGLDDWKANAAELCGGAGDEHSSISRQLGASAREPTALITT
jgi:hypothetical protein